MCYCPTPTLHLNLALTGDGAFIFSLKKTHSVWFISVLNYGDTENVLINHLLLVIPMSYPCHYTNLCPHKPHKHAHTHTHTHTHTKYPLNSCFPTVRPVWASAFNRPGRANSLGPVALGPKSWSKPGLILDYFQNGSDWKPMCGKTYFVPFVNNNVAKLTYIHSSLKLIYDWRLT